MPKAPRLSWLACERATLYEVESARENLRGLRSAVRLAKKVGTRLGEREVLQRCVPSGEGYFADDPKLIHAMRVARTSKPRQGSILKTGFLN